MDDQRIAVAFHHSLTAHHQHLFPIKSSERSLRYLHRKEKLLRGLPMTDPFVGSSLGTMIVWQGLRFGLLYSTPAAYHRYPSQYTCCCGEETSLRFRRRIFDIFALHRDKDWSSPFHYSWHMPGGNCLHHPTKYTTQHEHQVESIFDIFVTWCVN